MNLEVGDWVVTNGGLVSVVEGWRQDYEVWLLTIVFSRHNLLKHGERISLLPSTISRKLDRSPYQQLTKASPCPPPVVVSEVDWNKDDYWWWHHRLKELSETPQGLRNYWWARDFKWAQKNIAAYEGLMP